MKRLLAALLASASTVASAALPVTTFNDSNKTLNVIEQSPMAPLRIDTRVIFFAHATYNIDLQGIPAGTQAVIIWTVECKDMTEKFTVVSLKLPGDPPIAMYPNDEELAHVHRTKTFNKITNTVHEVMATTLCKEVK